MITPIQNETESAARKTVKKLTIEITDPEAVFAAYPAINREDYVKTIIDESKLRQKIRPIVNALFEVNQQVPGVRAYYAGEEPLEKLEEPLTVTSGSKVAVGAVADDLGEIPAHMKKPAPIKKGDPRLLAV